MYLIKRAAAKLPGSAAGPSSPEHAWPQPPSRDNGATGADRSPREHRRHFPAPSPATLHAPAAWLSPRWACTASCCCEDREAEDVFFLETVEEEQDDREEKEEVDEEDGEEEDEQDKVQAPPLSLPQPLQVPLASLALIWKASSLEVRYLSSSVQGRLTDRLGQAPRGLLFQGFSVWKTGVRETEVQNKRGI